MIMMITGGRGGREQIKTFTINQIMNCDYEKEGETGSEY